MSIVDSTRNGIAATIQTALLPYFGQVVTDDLRIAITGAVSGALQAFLGVGVTVSITIRDNGNVLVNVALPQFSSAQQL